MKEKPVTVCWFELDDLYVEHGEDESLWPEAAKAEKAALMECIKEYEEKETIPDGPIPVHLVAL